MKTDRLALVIVTVVVALAGCAGAGGGNGDGMTAADGAADGGAGGSADWCVEGQSMAMTDPQTGEQASWEVRGIVTEDDRQACRISWESNQGDVQRMDLFFTEDESYRKMVSYDADGNVVNELRLNDGASAGGSGGGTDVSTAGDSSASAGSWCTELGSVQFADPQTGERAAFEVQGIVQEDGRSVCTAVWTTNQGDVQRIEMYFTEDRSYQRLVYFDAEGNVINEIEVGSG